MNVTADEVFGVRLQVPAVAGLYLVLHFLAVSAGLLLQIDPPSIALFWPSAGALLGALLLYSQRYWLAILAAAVIAELAANAWLAPTVDLRVAAGLAGVSALEAVLGAAVVRKLLGKRLQLARIRTVLVFGAVVAVTTFLGGLVGGTVMRAADFRTAFWADQQIWWLGDFMSALTVAPLLLTFGYYGLRASPGNPLRANRSSLFACITLVAVLLIVFWNTASSNASLRDVPYLLCPVLIWIAMTSGPRRTAAAILTVIGMTSFATLKGYGPFGDIENAVVRAYQLAAFLTLGALPALIVQAAMHERRAALDAVKASEDRYRAFVANSSEAIFRTELDPPMPTALPMEQQLDWLRKHMVVAECNPAFVAAQGRTAESATVGTKPGEHPTWSQLYTERIREAITNNYRIKDIDHVIPGPYGLDRVLQVSMVGIVEGGLLHRVWGTARDITQLRRQEAALAEHDLRLRALATEITLAEERARRKLAADLHDGPAQNLVGLAMEIGVLRRNESDPQRLERIAELERIVADTSHQVRSLMAELTPPGLYDGGLVAGIRWLADRMAKQHRLTVSVEDDAHPKPLDEHTTVLLFQTVRELLQNVAKHARARQATVRCYLDGEYMMLDVIDPGVGFDSRALDSLPRRDGGFGLFSIRERLTLLGGTLRVMSEAGRGTTVRVGVPLRHQRGLFDEALSA